MFKEAFIGVSALVLTASSVLAEDVVTIPSTGIDIGGYITSGITSVGAAVAVAVGGYFAFLIVRKGLRWAGKALG